MFGGVELGKFCFQLGVELFDRAVWHVGVTLIPLPAFILPSLPKVGS
jgi:hypothetical protein